MSKDTATQVAKVVIRERHPDSAGVYSFQNHEVFLRVLVCIAIGDLSSKEDILDLSDGQPETVQPKPKRRRQASKKNVSVSRYTPSPHPLTPEPFRSGGTLENYVRESSGTVSPTKVPTAPPSITFALPPCTGSFSNTGTLPSVSAHSASNAALMPTVIFASQKATDNPSSSFSKEGNRSSSTGSPGMSQISYFIPMPGFANGQTPLMFGGFSGGMPRSPGVIRSVADHKIMQAAYAQGASAAPRFFLQSQAEWPVLVSGRAMNTVVTSKHPPQWPHPQ